MGTPMRGNNAIYDREEVREKIAYLNLALKDEQEFAELGKEQKTIAENQEYYVKVYGMFEGCVVVHGP